MNTLDSYWSKKDSEEIDHLQEGAEVQQTIEEIIQEVIWEIKHVWVDTLNRISIIQVTKAKRKH